MMDRAAPNPQRGASSCCPAGAHAAAPAAEPAIRLVDVSVWREATPILERVNAVIPRGLCTAIIGPNGAGKTTLIQAILGLIPYRGRIEFVGQGPGHRPRIGYVPQRLDYDRGTPIRVVDFLVMSRQRLPLWFGVQRKHRRRALECLAQVQGENLIDRPLGRLSGGELQRVQLALALQRDPEMLILDEPVSGVDVVGEKLFCDLLEQIQQDAKLTMAMVSHDLSVVSRHSGHVICLNKTVTCEGSVPEIMTAENLARLYGPHAGIYEHDNSQKLHGHGTCGHHHA